MPNSQPRIGRQLTSILLLSSGIVILLTCSALFAYQYLFLKNTAVRGITTLGQVIATNSTAALAFNNADDANATLAALQAEPQIATAALYDRDGNLFAKYPAAIHDESLPKSPGADGYHFGGAFVTTYLPVSERNSRRLGTLYLQSSMQAIYASFRLYGLIVFVAVSISALIAYFLATRLQRQISQPILALAETASAISARRDYSVRAEKPRGHELGLLTDAFNHMLARIGAQVGRLDLLQQITRAIAERQNLPNIFKVVIGTLEESMPIDFGCICLYDPLEKVAIVAGLGPHSESIAERIALTEHTRISIQQNGLSRCVLGHLVYEADIRDMQFELPQRLQRGELCSLVIAPLLVESQVFGVLIATRKQPDAFSSADCEFLRQLSEHVALAAHQTQLHDALQQAYEDLRRSQHTALQQERLRALGQMASGIAHDINNAISPVALYTESLLEREPNLSERARNYLTTIQRAIEDVAETVMRMREFYRQREPQLVLTTISLDRLAQQVIDFTRARWSDLPQEHGVVIRLVTDFAPNLPTTMGAEAEIRDALTNLIFNAVDAMPQGGTLTLRTRALSSDQTDRESPHSTAVAIEVSDTGIGMSNDIRQHCLEPFFTTKGERGTGLGLAMVYGMVQRHSAALEIDSEPGMGTTMRLVFPIATVIVTPSRGAMSAPVRRLRLLIVDDDPLLLKSLRDALEADGHIVTAADGGQAGIDAFAAAAKTAEPFSLVITDLGMPYVDGRKVAEQIKTRSPTTPILMLTGWGQRLIADNDIPAHVDRVLSKPPRLHELRAVLAELTQSATEAIAS